MDWSCSVSSPERPATVITGIPEFFFPPDMAYNALSSNAAWGRWATLLALDKVGREQLRFVHLYIWLGRAEM